MHKNLFSVNIWNKKLFSDKKDNLLVIPVREKQEYFPSSIKTQTHETVSAGIFKNVAIVLTLDLKMWAKLIARLDLWVR